MILHKKKFEVFLMIIFTFGKCNFLPALENLEMFEPVDLDEK